MKMQIVVQTRGRLMAYQTRFGPVLMDFRPIRTAVGEMVLVAEMPEDPAEAQRVLQSVQRSAGRWVVQERPELLAGTEWPFETGRKDVQPTELERLWRAEQEHKAQLAKPAAEPAATNAAFELVAGPMNEAIERGWSEQDLEGASGEKLSREEWTSSTAGLSLVEMAFCEPPPEWEALRGTKWPWQVDGFEPPTETWQPPELPDRAADPEGEGMLRAADGKFTDDADDDADGLREPISTDDDNDCDDNDNDCDDDDNDDDDDDNDYYCYDLSGLAVLGGTAIVIVQAGHDRLRQPCIS